MSAGMAEVIAAVLSAGDPRGNDMRRWPKDEIDAYQDAGGLLRGEEAARALQTSKLAAHVAEELAKSGYGSVQAAKAKVLREAAKDLASIAYVVPGGAGRAEYESRLAVRRGDTDKWLHARADLIDALADPEGHALVKAIRDRKAEA